MAPGGYPRPMSLPPEDRPTEPLRPRQAVASERVVAHEPAVDAGWAARIEDSLRSVKSMLAVVGVIALAALGLALYELLKDDDSGNGGASRERVAQLDARVDRLEKKAGGTSEESDVADVRGGLEDKADRADVEALGEQVEELRASVEAAGSGSEDAASTEDVAALGEQLEQLAADVQELQAQAEQQP